MKIRLGFVSNSSSSSFVCNVCGNVEEGYDGEYGIPVQRCSRGHEWCGEHLDGLTTDEMRIILNKDEEWINDVYGIDAPDDYELPKLFESYVNGFDYELPETLCPICSLREIDDSDLLKYICKMNLIEVKNIKLSIQGRFQTVKELHEYLRGDKE